ncbi:hypothetical protein RRG08_017292 [Elysia crispata]|uniref:Uncharacterized protein n=1 Tax=Elysia crispata TaxID=231223 RepID=A0AAE1E9A1_9GAST|nr:hypothetical protein RRG08_017292 [Elysia crispata]
MIEDHERRAPDVLDTLSTRPPEHYKRRLADMSDILDIEHAATRAPQVAGNRYVIQASHRARGHQKRAADMSYKLDIEHAAIIAPQVAGRRYVRRS